MALLLLALFALVLLPTFYAFYVAIRQSAIQQAETRLRSGGQIFSHALDERGAQLLEAVQVIASDFGFKQAVATGDIPTIRTVLYNHGHRVGADVTVLADLDGRVVASSDASGHSVDVGNWTALVRSARKREHFSGVRLLAGRPYQLVIVPVKAPRRIAWVGMGFALDGALAQRLGQLMQLDVSFVIDHGDTNHVVGSTLAAGTRRALADELDRTGPRSGKRMLRSLDGDEYLSLWKPLLSGPPPELGVMLQYPLAQAMAPFRALKRELFGIGLLSLLAAMAGALWLARTVTRPLSRLAQAARRVEQGDYMAQVGVRRRDELGDLAVAFEKMQRGIAHRERKIAHQAYHDSLTRLPNRVSLQERLEKAIHGAHAHGTLLAVLMLDIDGFKEINDTMGHAVGDRVLIEVGNRLGAALREDDVVARFGGDEFVVLLNAVRDDHDVRYLAERLGEAIASVVRIDTMELYLEVSIGAALCPEHGNEPGELLRRADIAMYDAKQSHSRLCLYHTGRDEKHLYRLSLVHDLRRAIPGGEMMLHYQPKLSLKSGRVTHVEALLRWNHPQHGLIPPDEFIPLAEHSGSIRSLTRWVLREVIRQCRDWKRSGLDIGVALNLSAMDLGSGELPDMLKACLHEFDVPADCLILEVTETAVMRDAKYSLEVLTRLKACGVQLTIDDFGTGYSSLSHLKRLPVDELKIDKSFVLDMARDNDDATIVRSTIELAHNMGLSVSAEGVEDEGALDMLRGYDCDTAQGYLISYPLAPPELEAWLRNDYAIALDPGGRSH